MCCGGVCNGSCSGNFTYVRFASDSNGSDFSPSKNSGGIDRCFQSIVTSPTKLDESSLSFKSLFNGKWFDVCNCGCGCKWFDYNTPDYLTNNGENTWTYSGSSVPTYSLESGKENKILVEQTFHNDLVSVPHFRDENDNPLPSLGEFCLEFNLLTKPGVDEEDEWYHISFGNGTSSTVIRVDHTTTLGHNKLMVTINSGTLPSGNLVIQAFNEDRALMESKLTLENIRLSYKSCCSGEDSEFVAIPSLDIFKSDPEYDIMSDEARNHTFVHLRIRGNGSNDWLNHEPKIYLFHKRATKTHSKLIGEERVKKRSKSGWVHPNDCDMGVTNNYWPRKTHISLGENEKFENLFRTMFDIPVGFSSGNMFELSDFNPKFHFFYQDMRLTSEFGSESNVMYPVPNRMFLNRVNGELHNNALSTSYIRCMNSKRFRPYLDANGELNMKGNTQSVANFCFAIGIKNPDKNSKIPVIFGDFSETIQYRVKAKRKIQGVGINAFIPLYFSGEIFPTVYRTRIYKAGQLT